MRWSCRGESQQRIRIFPVQFTVSPTKTPNVHSIGPFTADDASFDVSGVGRGMMDVTSTACSCTQVEKTSSETARRDYWRRVIRHASNLLSAIAHMDKVNQSLSRHVVTKSISLGNPKFCSRAFFTVKIFHKNCRRGRKTMVVANHVTVIRIERMAL